MRNSAGLPIAALVAAALFTLAGGIPFLVEAPPAASALTIGAFAAALTLALFGIQGLISIVLEGRELHVDRTPPRLTSMLSLGVVVSSVGLVATAVALGIGIFRGWAPQVVGSLSAIGSFLLAASIVCYKEAFVGDESVLQERDDGIPW